MLLQYVFFLPERVIHSSPRSDSGIPMATSLWILSVRNMWTPRPNSVKWSSQSRCFTSSVFWHKHTDGGVWMTQNKATQKNGDSTHVVAVGSRMGLVESRHESFTIYGVTQDLLLFLLLIGAPSVIIEGVVRCWGALRPCRGETWCSF